MSRVEALRERFDQQPGHDRLAADAERRSVRRRWSPGNQHFATDILPVMEELGAGEPALSDAELPRPHVRYGFDDHDRCVLLRRLLPDRSGRGGWHHDEFITYEGDTRWLMRFEHDGFEWHLDRVRRHRFADGRLIEEAGYYRYGGFEAVEFRYVGGRATERTWFSGDNDALKRAEQVHRDPTGTIVEITDGDTTTWRRPARTDAATVDEAADAIAAALAGGVEGLADREPWLIWLRYSADGPFWPDAAWPKLSVATRRDRDRLLARGQSVDWRVAWDWLDWEITELEIEPAEHVDEVLGRLEGEADIDPVNALMRAVATRLTATGRPKAVYVAVDQELIGIDDALAALEPHERVELAAAGLVPAT